MNWAMEQATGDPRAQCLLYVIADSANEEGVAWPGADWMAAKSQQSRATVYRRLDALQASGLLVMFPRWIDDNGKIWNAAASGRRRTSPEIRLQFEVFIKRIDIPLDDEIDQDVSPPQSQAETGVSHGSDGVVSPERQGSSHCSDNNHHLNQEKESPPTPPSGGGVGLSDGWEEFELDWQEPILRQSLARQVWDVLTEAERSLARKAARGYVAHRKAQKKPPNVINAQTFLKERDAWDRFAALAPADVVPITTAVFEAEGLPSWQARCVIATICGLRPPQAMGLAEGRGMRFPQPLTAAALALAQFSDDDPKTYLVIKAGTQQCGAWKQFLNIEPRPIVVGYKRQEITPQRFVDDWPVKESGLIVPRGTNGWPPRKDGTLSSTGPPDTTTEQDQHAQAKTG